MHKNNFNLMRLILSIMVVFSHSYGLLNISEPAIFGRSYGNFAVHCFFVISGYLIATSYLKSKNVLDFTYKRALRLVPAYIIAYFLAIFIANWCEKFVTTPVPYIRNGPVWTLSWEILCYGIIAVIGYFGLLKSSSIGTLWLVSWVLIISNFDSVSPTFQVIVPMLFMFLVGAFISVNEEKFRIRFSGPVSIVLLIITVINPVFLPGIINKMPWLYGPQFTPEVINYFLYLFLLPIAIMYIGKYFPYSLSIKDDISYGVYIYAWPIQQATIYWLQENKIEQSPLQIFAISVSITIVLSYLSWRIIEKPVNSLKRFDVTRLMLEILRIKKKAPIKDEVGL